MTVIGRSVSVVVGDVPTCCRIHVHSHGNGSLTFDPTTIKTPPRNSRPDVLRNHAILHRVAKNPLTFYELCDSPVALEAYRGGKVIHTRYVSRVHDYSQPDQLIEGQLPCIEIVGRDRFMAYTLSEGQRLEFDAAKGVATFVSNGVTYRIRPLTSAERNRLG